MGGQSIVTWANPNNAAFNYVVDRYNQTEFVLGVRGFEGFTILYSAQWGWTVLNTTADTATLNIDKYQLMFIYFSYFQIGQY